jgi:hypothetical protein
MEPKEIDIRSPSDVPAETKSPPTEYALFNDLKKAMGNVAHWQSIVEHDPTNAKNKEELAGAAKKNRPRHRRLPCSTSTCSASRYENPSYR